MDEAPAQACVARRRIAVVVVGVLAVLAPMLCAVTPAVAVEPPAGVQAVPVDESTAYQVDSAHTGSIDGSTQRPPLIERWRRDLGGTVSYPVITGGRTFVVARGTSGAYGTTLYAIDSATGEDIWGPIDLGGTYYWSGIAAGDGRLFALTFDGIMRAYDQATGDLDWIVDLPGAYAFSSEPSYRNGIVYTGGAGSGGTVYAVDAIDGDVLWTAGVAGGDHSSPAVTDDAVVVSYACEQTYSFEPATGAVRWHHSTGCSGGGGRTPVAANDRVWVRDDAGAGPIVLDAATGALVNTFSGQVAPAMHGSAGFFLDGKVLKAKDATTLMPRWTFAGDGGLVTAPIVVNGYVYVGSSSGRLYALDETTGREAWSSLVGAPMVPPDEHNVASPVAGLGAGDGLIVAPASNLLVAFERASSAYVPLVPVRLLDTRPGPGQQGYTGPGPAPGATIDLQVLGRGGVPTTGVRAVALTVTATEATSFGHVTAWPSGAERPLASNLNVERAGQTIANQVVVPVGANGRVSLHTTAGGHVVADVAGYFTLAARSSSGRFVPVTPERILDTRPTGSRVGYTGAKPKADAEVVVHPLGRAGVPVSGVSAVAVNVTATEAEGAGFVTAYPSNAARPLASNVNMERAGQTIAASATVPLSPDGTFTLYTPTATHLVVDVAGYYTDSSAPVTSHGLFEPVTPTRVVDTRPTGPQLGYGGQKPTAGAIVTMDLDGPFPTEAGSPVAALFNLTATEAEAVGFVAVSPHGVPRPLVSNLNVDHEGQTVPNLVVSGVDADGFLDVFTSSSTHLVADVAGYFQG